MAKQTPNDGSALSQSRYSEQRAPQFVGGDVDTASGNIIPATKQDAAQGKTPTGSAQTPDPVMSGTLLPGPPPDQMRPLENAGGTVRTPRTSATSFNASNAVPSNSTGGTSLPDTPQPSITAPAQPTTRLASIDASPSNLPSFTPTPVPATAAVSAKPPSVDYGQIGTAAALGIGSKVGGDLLSKGVGSLFSSGSKDNSSSGTSRSPSFEPSNNGASGVDESGFVTAYNPASPPSSPTAPSYAGASSFDESGFADPGASSPAPYQPPADAGPVASSFNDLQTPVYEPAAPAPTPTYAPPPYSGQTDFFGNATGGGGDTGGSAGVSIGTVVCTELHRQGLLEGITWQADQAFGAWVIATHPEVYDGYIAWARPCARLMQGSARFTKFVNWFAAPWAKTMAARMGCNGVAPLRGILILHFGWQLCRLIGRVRAMRAGLADLRTQARG